jgi:molybdopterin molybdotransferase
MQAQSTHALSDAVGQVLAEGLVSLVDLPPFDTAAMDGWAVRGPGPWELVGEVRAGDAARSLRDGECVQISTGAVAPDGSAVLRSERGRVEHGKVRADDHTPPVGHDIRHRGEEVRSGDPILGRGQVLTPPAVGLAAAAGHDTVDVVARPRVSVLVLGDELVHTGVPSGGRLRDALAPQLPGWIEAMGAVPVEVTHVRDDLDSTERALMASPADIVMTTGGTARGPADHIRGAVAALGGRWLVDGVSVRPGHPMKLGVLPGDRSLVALPGNPLAAVSGLVTLAWPLINAQSGRPPSTAVTRPLAGRVDSSPGAHRLVPGQMVDGTIRLTTRPGPAMLSGMAVADALAVIPPGHAGDAGTGVQVIALPWGSGLLV